MSTPINDGGPAFPRTKSTGNLSNSTTEIVSVGGMSLRDWFAGQALASVALYAQQDQWAKGGPEWRDAVASESYKLADAMLEACNQKGGQA